jgi:hypothetical protein
MPIDVEGATQPLGGNEQAVAAVLQLTRKRKQTTKLVKRSLLGLSVAAMVSLLAAAFASRAPTWAPVPNAEAHVNDARERVTVVTRNLVNPATETQRGR